MARGKPYQFLMISFVVLHGCFAFEFFTDEKSAEQPAQVEAGPVLGQPIGQKAGSIDASALQALYAVSTTIPPAPIRPDPDLHVRRILQQYQPVSATMARLIGSIEAYRGLLGGASEDFQKLPQESYDATSLLSTIQVAEVVCEALLAPNPKEHPGWTTILPTDPADVNGSLRFLAQRFIGLPSSLIADQTIADLQAILAEHSVQQQYSHASYIPVCIALSLDAEALFL